MSKAPRVRILPRFIQLIAAPWEGQDGNHTYSLYALDDTGEVYRLVPGLGAWKRIGKEVATQAQLDEYYARDFDEEA